MMLHWSVVFLVLAMMKGSAGDMAFRWALVAAGGLWVGFACVLGLMARPGPKLAGRIRLIYRPAHIALYGLVAASSLINALSLLGFMPDRFAWYSLLILFGAGMLHGLFQLWRHTALYDGALRTMTPKLWHKHL